MTSRLDHIRNCRTPAAIREFEEGERMATMYGAEPLTTEERQALALRRAVLQRKDR